MNKLNILFLKALVTIIFIVIESKGIINIYYYIMIIDRTILNIYYYIMIIEGNFNE